MALKIENRATIKAPTYTEQVIQDAFEVIPREHLRGLNRIVLVDFISPHQRIQLPNASQLPGLYHPKMGNEHPYFEIALGVLLPKSEGFMKNLMAKMNFKTNLVSLIYSLQGQHFHLTLSHGVKKGQFESVVRSYMEKYFTLWRERNAGWRAKLFKPFRPMLQKWARKIRAKYEAEQKKQ